jgi:hypothetical protein
MARPEVVRVGSPLAAGAALLFLAWTSASMAAAQIVAPAGRTLFNEGVLVRSVFRLETFEASTDESRRRRLANTYALVWGARPHLSLSLVTPFVRTTEGGESRTGSADSIVFARYDVVRKAVQGGYTRLAPELGVKLPTGGAFGTGSTDVIGGLVFSHVRDPDWWIADVQLALPGTGDRGVRAGERVRIDLAYLRRVWPRRGLGVPMTLAVLEFNGETASDAERNGSTVPGTGGDRLFLSPGVEHFIGRRVVLEAAFPIPVYQHSTGTRPKLEPIVILGLRWLV